MDNLKSLMQCVDHISNVIPEGTYLEMCDNIKQLHDTINEEDPVYYDEWIENEELLKNLENDLKIIERSLRNLRYIKNITIKVREDAIKNYCDYDAECVGNKEWTFENLNDNMSWELDSEREEFTSKTYERKIYENYRYHFNKGVENLRKNAREERVNIEREINTLCDRQHYLENIRNVLG